MQDIDAVKNRALDLMRKAGFPILEEIEIAIDEKLPFMGYTTQKNGKPLIVVSQWGATSEMGFGLVIHELSHIYRTETHHPSHNFALQEKVLQLIFGDKKLPLYQREIIHGAVNSIQDLYADDIFFKVFTTDTVDVGDFFLGWIHTPVNGASPKSMWTNASYVVSAAFAQANLERHSVSDTNGKINNAIEDFLRNCLPIMKEKYVYFKHRMVTLPEKIIEEEFGNLLVAYMQNFLQLTIGEA